MSLESKGSVYARWVINRIIKALIVYIIAFVTDVVILIIINQKFPVNTFKNLITLSMPGTTTWYLKIQLLYYVVIALVALLFRNKKNAYLISLVVISVIISIPFYLARSSWWNGYTGMCFTAGVLVAMYSEQINNYVQRKYSFLITIALLGAVICYGITVFGFGGYLVQVIVFPILCGAVVIIAYRMQGLNKIWMAFGSASLSIYLIHIGLIRGIFIESNYNELAFSLFILATVVGSITTYFTSNKLNELIGKR